MLKYRVPRSFIPFFLLLLALACKYAAKSGQPTPSDHHKPDTEMPEPNMPGHPGDYAAEWKAVDSLERQGLFKSALERVEKIQALAARERNTPQVIKSLLYRGKYVAQLEEDGFVNAVQLFEQEEKKAALPEKAILQSILGQLYATYLGNRGWQISERTPIPDGEGGDLLTWSAAQIEQRALDYYAASVASKEALISIPVESFRDILTPGSGDTIAGQVLRPSLYDLLAHRALEHFANDRSWLSEPAYAFQLDQAEAFAPAAVFVNTTFASRDSSSGKWHAIRLFSDILSTPGRPESSQLVADLLRLQFAYHNSARDDKDSLYRQALETLQQQRGAAPAGAEVTYALAQFLYGNAPSDSLRGEYARRAVQLCETAIKQHPGTYGAAKCLNLLEMIRSASLFFNIEDVSLPEQPALMLLRIKNLERVYVRVVRGNFDSEFLEDLNWNERLAYVKKLPQVQARKWEVKNPGDYQEHTTEIALDALPVGQYCVLVSANESFDPKKGHVCYATFAVSRLAGVPFRERGNTRIVSVDRATGAALAGVKAEFFAPRYMRQGKNRLLASATSDEKGMIDAQTPDNQQAETRLSLNGDTLWIGNTYRYRVYNEPVPRPQVHFFTDRALYRPGQTVYFKGVFFQLDAEKKPQILPNRSVTAKLLDVNGQEKAVLALRSNAFGTFNGAFTAPAFGLTGQMSIRVDEAAGNAYFNVEEYKRPKFEVTFKPVEKAFRLGEQITMTGEAKAYAGSNIDGAEVRYRVVRVARLPYWDWRRISPPWRSGEMEIANGVVTTDAEGRFDVPFTAVPDRSIPKSANPVFDYTVYADVTDISGETRSNQANISVGYIALQVDWGISTDVHIDSLKNISLSTRNLAGQPQAASGQITMQALEEPEQFFKERYWEKPDLHTIPKSGWNRLFPGYAWSNEDEPENWPGEGQPATVPFNTATGKSVNMGEGTHPGYYIATLTTKDAYGEKVEIRKVVRVWNERSRFEKPSASPEKMMLEPGETTHIYMGGKPAGLHFFFAREQDGMLAQPRWLSGSASVEIPVAESDRGGIAAHWFSVWDNRIYRSAPLFLQVPWSNKDLNIRYETFRDKLAPGQREEWRLHISGPKKEKVAAEMVAAMYDASLDQFLPHHWTALSYPTHYARVNIGDLRGFGASGSTVYNEATSELERVERQYSELNWFNFPLWGSSRYLKNYAADGIALERAAAPLSAPAPVRAKENDVNIAFDSNGGNFDEMVVSGEAREEEKPEAPGPKTAPPSPIRSNLNETVFFFPELHTDANGDVVLSFTMNEALTRWKLLTYAHTKDLQQGISVKEVVTQKDLMVLTNPPRFLRAGDELEFSAKVSNLSQETLSGKASLGLLDANTLKPLEAAFGLTQQSVDFSVAPGRSAPLSWRLRVPDDFTGAVTWQVFADGKSFRDGEESTVPVVTNRMLVTESLPITVRGKQSKKFVFESMTGPASTTRVPEKYTLEFSSNPAWYAVQALPYLMEFPYECTEQIFSRFYANTLASSVVEKMPNIRRIYERWKGTDALKSNLSKNQELKYALLEETPWVLEAQSEEQQKQNIALLFDLNRMNDERARTINILSERQLPGGGWAWFPGGRDSWYITQHILSGFGHLQHLNAFGAAQDPDVAQMTDHALGYCTGKMTEQYRKIEAQVQAGKAKWEDDHLDGMIIHYLYARSFFPETEKGRPGREFSYYLDQAEKYWLGKGLYQEGMLALALHRSGRTEAAKRIVASLRERATVKEELGMFWPVDWGFYWYQLPVETQALMVEVFGEVGQDQKAVEELRIWLLKNKQTNRWESTKATAEAVYALLLFGDNWLNNNQPVQVSLGGKTIKPAEYEPGTGYFKESWAGTEIKSTWSTIQVSNPNTNIVWGAAYWQYFEDLDKIGDFQKTPLTIVKQLFLEENSPTGPVLKPVAEGQMLHRGDRIKVRIEIRVDRAMEYVHLKDMRAAGFEPVNVLSGYRWQDGLGYYESTKDLATHFFIDYLPRGTFVFEYPLVVTHKGDMSNGVTTMQCMYAPEFTSHSKGIRVKVE
ncbi:MAG: hypothetical protein H6565_11170 [Lewinellaceae bacterium]|nr:hypothetical protein [Lewinellaceae bacterium]